VLIIRRGIGVGKLKLAGVFTVVIRPFGTKFVGLSVLPFLAIAYFDKHLFPSAMHARPLTIIEAICTAAAVVLYVECPDTGNLVPLPVGMALLPGQEVLLTLDAN
jgi:hypothetical protein